MSINGEFCRIGLGLAVPGLLAARDNPTLQPPAHDQTSSTSCISSQQRSLLAELELKAAWHGTPLEVARIDVAPGVDATIHVLQRRLGPISTGVGDAIVLLPEGVDRFDAGLLAGHVVSTVGADLVVARVVGAAPLSACPHARIRLAVADRGRRCHAFAEYRDVRQVLRLETTDADFLARLGRSTRRNIEKCRKDATRLGMRFRYVLGAEAAEVAQLAKLARHNMPTPTGLRKLAGVRSLIARQGSLAFHATLARDDGRLVSAAGGLVDGQLALLLYQYNHRADHPLSPSLMMRSRLIAQLIAQGIREVAFVGGCSGVLVQSCDRVCAADMLVVRASAAGMVKHWLARKADPKGRVARLSDRN